MIVNPPRSRSFGGCAACRKRRLKCDEARPQCSTCALSGQTCTYEKNLFFGPDDHLDFGETRYRRPVLSEKERQLMSEWITTKVAPSTAVQLIAQIEEECEAVEVSKDVEISHGPFGAFRVGQSTQAPPQLSSQGSLNKNAVSQSAGQDTGFEVVIDGVSLSPGTQELMNLIFDGPIFGLQSSTLAPEHSFLSNRVDEVFDDLQSARMPHPDSITGYHSGFDVPHGMFSAFPSRSTTPLAFSSVQHVNSAITQQAVPLLKHYQSTILPLLTPFRHSKTPWHILFVPEVKNCLAALTLGEVVDPATLCAFYGTLSISALSLGATSRRSEWTELAIVYKQLARRHVKTTLETAYDIPKKAKYKSILVALLTMVQLSIVSGNPDRTNIYLLEAERFIRLRGLQRRKSRKVRLLHHCYAFERILFESTRVRSPNESYRLPMHSPAEATELSHAGESAAPFCLGHWTNLEAEMLRVKSREEGENDLHLQLPGDWSATLYPEIFGVPEQWILLVSLVIQLTKESSEQQNRNAGLSVKGFLDRAKGIETMINQLHSQVADPELSNLLEAMQNALAIYFYRRIYNVDAAVLQGKVVSVRDCLLRTGSIYSESAAASGAARFIWPAFIAACEAEDPGVQFSFSSWFRNSAQRSGLRLFTTTLSTLQELWETKSSSHSARFVPLDNTGDSYALDDNY